MDGRRPRKVWIAKMSQDSAKTPAPPYIPFKTFSNWIEKLDAKNLPPQIDTSFLSTMAGGQQLPFIATLKWFGLIDDDKNVMPKLREIVAAKPEERRALVKAVIAPRYQWVDPLNEKNATLAQLEDAFKAKGPTGSTLRKSIVFYLQAAEYCEIKVSPNFKVRGYISKTGKSTTRTSRPKGNEGGGTPTPAPPTGPTPTSAEALRIKYIEMLMKKADEKDDPDLLDRIEKLLGASTTEGES
jgi:hypothetical protein